MKAIKPMEQARIDKSYLQDFIPQDELNTIWRNCRGEEGLHFIDKLRHMSALIHAMPKTYEQDGKGQDSIAYLHYFNGGMDWYITEKDMGDGTSDRRQHQAFGLAAIGYEPSLGYISIQELIENNVELDLYFDPKPLNQLPER